MQYPAFFPKYDALEQECVLFDELLRARKDAGLTQAEVAERIGCRLKIKMVRVSPCRGAPPNGQA